MSTPSTPPAGARGAVDLSRFAGGTGAGGRNGSAAPTRSAGQPSPAGPPVRAGQPGSAGQAGARGIPEGLVVLADDQSIGEAINRSLQVPAVLTLWSSAHQQTAALVDLVAAQAATLEGRVFVISADVQTSPGILQAFQQVITQAFGQLSIPATFGLLQGQPVPLFPGIPQDSEIKAVLDQLVQAAIQNGVTGRVDLGPIPGDSGEPELPPLHAQAYAAIDQGDLDGAAAAYEQALSENPKDHEAELGLAQVRLMQRTQGVDAAAARTQAAAAPTDVDAQIVVADLDILAGNVADAFDRLIDTVKSTDGEDRVRVRSHLLELFGLVGNHDERVRKGRTALMNALF